MVFRFRNAVAIQALTCLAILAGSGRAADRVALVIGNSKYERQVALANPGNDADAVASALEGLQFKVIKKKDLDKQQMDDAAVEFYRALKDTSVAFFYYAGHGFQVDGANYLVPVAAKVRERFEVKGQCFPVANILGAMQDGRARVNVVVLDCCRNNPFRRGWTRTTSEKGLAAINELPQGTLIAFATSPDKEASDGDDNANSPYTAQLVRVLRSRPGDGLELVRVFREASRAVKEATGQTPWLNMEASLPDFHLWKPGMGAEPPRPPRQVKASFTVRRQHEDGPLAPGVDVEVLWRADAGAAPSQLGAAPSDSQGVAAIALSLDERQQQGGAFAVRLQTRESSKEYPLPSFPGKTEWALVLPESAPAPPPVKPPGPVASGPALSPVALQSMLALGDDARAAGDLTTAVVFYDWVLRLAPGNPSAHLRRGAAFLALGRRADAQQERQAAGGGALPLIVYKRAELRVENETTGTVEEAWTVHADQERDNLLWINSTREDPTLRGWIDVAAVIPATAPGPRTEAAGAIAGSVWDVRDSDGQVHVFLFSPDGRFLRLGSSGLHGDGKWTLQADGTLSIEVGRGAAKMQARPGADTMNGRGESAPAGSWTWRAQRR